MPETWSQIFQLMGFELSHEVCPRGQPTAVNKQRMRALHTDLEPLEIVCQHYRTAHGDALIAAQRRIIGALLKAVHDLSQRTANQTHNILDLTHRLALVQWDLFLMRGWRRAARTREALETR